MATATNERIAASKTATVDRILDNSTYQTDSGLYQRTRAALLKLPQPILANLELLIQLKIAAAGREKAKAEKEVTRFIDQPLIKAFDASTG